MTPEEILEEFAEAAQKGKRHRSLSLRFGEALSKDLGVVGGSKMPWGDDSNFAAWCERQEPIVRQFFAKAIAEREVRDDKSPSMPGSRLGLTPEQMKEHERDVRRKYWQRVPLEVKAAYRSQRRANEDEKIRAFRATQPVFVIPQPAPDTEVTCRHCLAVNRLREGSTRPDRGWCCAIMRRDVDEWRRLVG